MSSLAPINKDIDSANQAKILVAIAGKTIQGHSLHLKNHGINRDYQFYLDIEFPCEDEVESLSNQKVMCTLYQQGKAHYIWGQVITVTFLSAYGQNRYYRMECCSPLSVLTNRKTPCVYTNHKVDVVIAYLLNKNGIKNFQINPDRDYPTIDYYQLQDTSDYDLILHLCHHYQIEMRYEFSAVKTMIYFDVVNPNASHLQLNHSNGMLTSNEQVSRCYFFKPLDSQGNARYQVVSENIAIQPGQRVSIEQSGISHLFRVINCELTIEQSNESMLHIANGGSGSFSMILSIEPVDDDNDFVEPFDANNRFRQINQQPEQILSLASIVGDTNIPAMDDKGAYRLSMLKHDYVANDDKKQVVTPLMQASCCDNKNQYGMHFPLYGGTVVATVQIKGAFNTKANWQPVIVGAISHIGAPSVVKAANEKQLELTSFRGNGFLVDDWKNTVKLHTANDDGHLTLDNSHSLVNLSCNKGKMTIKANKAMSFKTTASINYSFNTVVEKVEKLHNLVSETAATISAKQYALDIDKVHQRQIKQRALISNGCGQILSAKKIHDNYQQGKLTIGGNVNSFSLSYNIHGETRAVVSVKNSRLLVDAGQLTFNCASIAFRAPIVDAIISGSFN